MRCASPDSSRRSAPSRSRPGIEKPNVLPTPTLLSSHMRPPSSSTRRLESVRPRPVPSSREPPRPPCWNDSKIRCRSASGTPMPLSVTVISTSAPRRRARTTTEPPAPVNLTALVIRLSAICLSRSTSECTTSTSSATSTPRLTPPSIARWRSMRGGILQQRLQPDLRVLQVHPTGLDLREVEDLVQELEQVSSRAVDVVEVLLLTLVDVAEHPLEQNFGEPEHGVQRGAQLVGHAGQELRLVPAGQLELEALLLELAVEPGVLQGQCRLAREGLHQVDRLVGEATGPLATDDERPDDLVLAEHRHRHQRAPAVVVQDLEVRVEGHGAQVGTAMGRRSRAARPTNVWSRSMRIERSRSTTACSVR